MGNEVSAAEQGEEEQGGATPASSKQVLSSSLDGSTHDDMALFGTPVDTPITSLAPSPSISALASPIGRGSLQGDDDHSLSKDVTSPAMDVKTGDYLLRSPPDETEAATDNNYDDTTDTVDKPPQQAPLHTSSVPPPLEEDHAWMDPVLAAAAAGAASKKLREEKDDLQRTMSFGFDDDEWRDSLQRLASSTLAQIAAPALTADSVKGDKGKLRQDGVSITSGTTSSRDDAVVDDDWRESLQRLTSATHSTAATFAQVAAPVLHDAADTVKKSFAHGENSSSETIREQAKTAHPENDDWEASLDHLASTTESAAARFVHCLCCDNDAVKKTASADVGEAVAVHPADFETKEETDETVNVEEGESMNEVALVEQDDNKGESVCGKVSLVKQDRSSADSEWKESLERFALITKSASAAFAHLAAPVLSEAADTLKKSVTLDETDVEQSQPLGKYVGAGDRATGGEENTDVNEEGDEWKESLQRLAASTISTASSFVTITSPIVSESTTTVIEMAKEAAETYRESMREEHDSKDRCKLEETVKSAPSDECVPSREPDQTDSTIAMAKAMTEPDVSCSNVGTVAANLDTSQDETVITSPGWHRKPPRPTPSALSGHNSKTVDAVDPAQEEHTGDSIVGSPGSLMSPPSLETMKSLVSQTSTASPEKVPKSDRGDNDSIASLSVSSSRSVLSARRAARREKEKSLLSSPGKFVEMVSKKLASDTSGYPPTQRRGRKASRRSRGASRTGSITPSPRIPPNQFSFSLEQSVFQEQRQPENQVMSSPDSPQESGQVARSLTSTPPRLQPPGEVSLWDMLPENKPEIMIGQGGRRPEVLVEPRPRLVVESACNEFQQEEVRSGSTCSSGNQSLPMSTGFIGKRKIPHIISSDAASDPGRTPCKRRRKSRPSQTKPRSSKHSIVFPPYPLSPSSSFPLEGSLNIETRPMLEELSHNSQCDSEQSLALYPDVGGHSKISGPADRHDSGLDEALLAFSTLKDVDFLSYMPPQSVPDSLQSLASVWWRQFCANWEHDEMMKAIASRPCSIHSLKEPPHHEEHANEWSYGTWTTTVFDSKRDEPLSLSNEFHSSRKASRAMANLSGDRPLLCDGELQCLTSFFSSFGPRVVKGVGEGSSVRHTGLRQALSSSRDVSLDDLLHAAKTKRPAYSGLVKRIATFATNNSDPVPPKTAVRYSVDIKAADAIVRKADRKYNGDVLQVKDVLRGQIIVPDESSLVCVLMSLNASCGEGNGGGTQKETLVSIPEVKIVRMKNLFHSSPSKTPPSDHLPTGYRHILITVCFSDGFLAELQLQLSQMFDVLGQQGYDLHRQIIEMDVACQRLNISDFDHYTCDTKLREILQRMFRPGHLKPCNPATKAANADTMITRGRLSKDMEDNKPKPDQGEQRTIHGEDNDDASKRLPLPVGGGIAAAAAMAARNRTVSDGQTSSEDKAGNIHPLSNAGGIAAAAALAARSRAKASEGEASDKDNAAKGGTASDDVANIAPFPVGGGIAAAAALAARNRSKVSETAASGEDNADKGSTGREEETTKDDVDGEQSSSNVVVVVPPVSDDAGGIAAAVALAARNRTKASKGEEVSGDNLDTRGTNSEEAVDVPPLPVGGGIAAAAALAARNRIKVSEGEASSKDNADNDRTNSIGGLDAPPLPVGGGIAAAAAQAARNRNEAIDGEANSEGNADKAGDEAIDAPALPVGVAAAAAAAARNRGHALEQGESAVEKADKAYNNGKDVGVGPSVPESADTAVELATHNGGIEGTTNGVERIRRDVELFMNISNCSVHDVLQAIIYEALRDASVNCRRISTLYCTAWLCFGFALGSPQPIPMASQLDESDSERKKHVSFLSLSGDSDGYSGFLPQVDVDVLVRVSEKALLRSLTIANQAVSNGMIGWLEYGSSNFLDRTAGRPLDVLGKVAFYHAMRKDWGASVDVLKTLVLRCEHYLPLYHPLTLSSMLDLAGALMMLSEHSMAQRVMSQAGKRLAFYLAEQEEAYTEFHNTLRFGSQTNVRFQELTGGDHVSMLRAFVSLFEELLDRDFLQISSTNNDVFLLNQCLVGDSFCVLASCSQLSESRLTESRQPRRLRSNTYWSAAYEHYRIAFEAWAKRGLRLDHPNVSAVTCSIARCLRELGETDKARMILNSVIGASGQDASKDAVKPKRDALSDDTCHDDFPLVSFLPSTPGSSHAQAAVSIEQSTAMNLWCMAAYTVETSQDERGRIRALSLLHASSEALQRALQENGDDCAAQNSSYVERLRCVEDEARELFKPLEGIRTPERNAQGGGVKSTKEERSLRKQEPYIPTRAPPSENTPEVDRTTKTSETDDYTSVNQYPQRRHRRRPKTNVRVSSALA